jgi:drug/metabolite transporter (DMT)-like permease
MTATTITTSRVHVVLLLLMSALIGGMFPLLKIAEQSIPPLTLTMLRTLFAATVMLFSVALLMRRPLGPLRTYWRPFAIMGLLLSVFLVSISEAEEYISASLTAVLGCITPTATFLITTLIMRWEAFSWLRFAGTIIALVGVLLFIGVGSLAAGRSMWVGVAIMGSGYSLYAINLIYARFLNLDPFITATGTFLFAAFFMLCVAFGFEQPLATRPSLDSLLAALVVGVFCTAGTYLLLYYLIAHAGPVFAATSSYLFPIMALLLGHLMLNEDLDWSHAAGLAITLTGAWLINRNPAQAAA